MKHIYSFEKLNVWQKSRELSIDIYRISSFFPDSEKFSLVNQMRRASISISSNIAEGSSRSTSKDQSHFYNIAHSSLMELLSQLILGLDLNYLSISEYNSIRNEIDIISKLLSGLRKSRIGAQA
ncbi:four helix bundle protein [Hyphobacterium sp. CCMP332]|nr:four helix bundle protein [Hyphobacterium sp. CCMP332]